MQYLFTERAHLMCPHMNFGIAMAVRHPFDENRIRETIGRLSAAHPGSYPHCSGRNLFPHMG